MASAWNAGFGSVTGIVECGLVAGDSEPPVGFPLGFKAVNPANMINDLTSGIDLGAHTLIYLSFMSGLAFESSTTALSGFDLELDPLSTRLPLSFWAPKKNAYRWPILVLNSLHQRLLMTLVLFRSLL
jgi:hypothetical protein